MGFYQFVAPEVFLKDVDLIKQIAVKDFDHFTDHQGFAADSDILFSSNLFTLKGSQWREMRTILSPAFTSSKMRVMFALIKQTADQFVEYYAKQGADVAGLDMKDAFTRYTNDVIATTAFGITVNSVENRENEFYRMGKVVSTFDGVLINIKFLMNLFFPKFFNMLGLTFLGQQVNDYFVNLTNEALRVRRENNVVRPDVIHLLMEAQKGKLKHDDENEVETGFAAIQESSHIKKAKSTIEITDEVIAAQAVIFFVAGFDTVSAMMCFAAYELAANPEIQSRLREEVNEAFEETNGKITYEKLLSMKYLDMVISGIFGFFDLHSFTFFTDTFFCLETLRMWPNAIALNRICTKPYTIQPATPDEKPLHLRKDDALLIPIYNIHHDPKHYPDPEVFDPERFSEENKSKINPYAYMPFGIGPRACIGSRFALLETKMIFCNIIRNFEIVFNEKMTVPLELDLNNVNMNAKGGFWFDLKRINTN